MSMSFMYLFVKSYGPSLCKSICLAVMSISVCLYGIGSIILFYLDVDIIRIVCTYDYRSRSTSPDVGNHSRSSYRYENPRSHGGWSSFEGCHFWNVFPRLNIMFMTNLLKNTDNSTHTRTFHDENEKNGYNRSYWEISYFSGEVSEPCR
jgi:hypothetical protein